MGEEGNLTEKTRRFGCSCGKDYLSYAALFTHIKQKHQGKAPGPIIRPRSQRMRGRPRKTPHPNLEDKKSNSGTIQNTNRQQSPIQINNSFQHALKKKKQAAEILLGSGSFRAFQIYKPEVFNTQRQSLVESDILMQQNCIPSTESNQQQQRHNTTTKTSKMNLKDANNSYRRGNQFRAMKRIEDILQQNLSDYESGELQEFQQYKSERNNIKI